MKIKKILNLVSKILFNVMALIFGLTLIAGSLLTNDDVSNLLTSFVFKDKPADVVVSTGKEPVRYKTWYSSVEDTLNGNGQIARIAQAEGTVLLKNEENALPLAAGTKVSLYGVTAYDPMYCLDGAGNNKINDPKAYNGLSEVDRRQFFYDEFKKAGLDMNEKLKEWYNSDAGKHYWRRDYVGFWGLNSGLGYAKNDNGKIPALTEAAWDEIDATAKDSGAYGKGTTAIYITGRMTNEILDLTSEGAGSSAAAPNGNNDGLKENVDYLALTKEEKSVLAGLKENYEKVIVIFNQANAPQEDVPALLDEYGVDAALWIGFPGSDGIKAVADILMGKTNPSGGLSAAWYTSRNENPSTQNFAISGVVNVVNVEGMYVGYRYAETRYEDTLLNKPNAGDYNYGASISYPFGYGLSYSTFSYSNIEIAPDADPAKNYYSGGLMASNAQDYHGNYGKPVSEEDKRATGTDPGDCDDIIMKVTVTNTGNVKGKEIVQIYLQQPITEQDKAHGVQKPSVQLVGYGKTKELAPNESEVVEVKIDANKWFAAYDSRIVDDAGNRGGYVLSAGDYKLVAARNSHEAVNSIYKAANNGSIPNAEKFVAEYGAGDAALVKTVTVSATRSANYKYWTQGTTDEVHNLFEDIDPNMDDNNDNDVAYFSRYDWSATAYIQNGRIGQDARDKTGSALGVTDGFDSTASLTTDMIDAYEQYYGIEFDNTNYTFGWSGDGLQLSDLIGVEYDRAKGATDEDVLKWAQLVGQMSSADMRTLFSAGLRKTMSVASIGKPGTNDQNASNGFEWAFGKGNGDLNGDFESKNANYGFMLKFDPKAPVAYPTGYPCEGIIAASFNNEIAYLVGQAIGEDALWGGASGLYGFGLGLQRNPYHGRAGEFYSDDSFLTGMIGAYSTKGAQEKGCYVYNKHFVLNDQDTDRNKYRSWLDEQTFRQIYLRPFEMAIEIGDAMNVMIAFNELGDAWTGSNYNLMTRWLRGEAGMTGFALSDYAPADGENIGYGMLAGACLLDGNTSSGYSAGVDARYDNRLVEAATRILYTVANSNAMNFVGDDVNIYTFDPLWWSTRDALLPGISITVYVLFGLSCAFAAGMTGWKLYDKYLVKKED